LRDKFPIASFAGSPCCFCQHYRTNYYHVQNTQIENPLYAALVKFQFSRDAAQGPFNNYRFSTEISTTKQKPKSKIKRNLKALLANSSAVAFNYREK